MAKYNGVSISVIRRMPRYYRFLGELKDKNIFRISSKELAERMGTTASQIRQDLNCFGGFGQQGYGYDVEKLYEELGHILGIGNRYDAILVGCGNLGRAVAINLLNSSDAFRLTAAFDKNPMHIGASIQGLPVLDSDSLSEFCADHKPAAAFLCIPTESAETVVETLYACGVRCFWNFSHYDIVMHYPDAVVENVHLTDSLLTLCYQITDALENTQQ